MCVVLNKNSSKFVSWSLINTNFPNFFSNLLHPGTPHLSFPTGLRTSGCLDLKNKGIVRLDTLVETFWLFLLKTTLLPIHQHRTTANSTPESSSNSLGLGWEVWIQSASKCKEYQEIAWNVSYNFGHPFFCPLLFHVESGFVNLNLFGCIHEIVGKSRGFLAAQGVEVEVWSWVWLMWCPTKIGPMTNDHKRSWFQHEKTHECIIKIDANHICFSNRKQNLSVLHYF